MILFDSEISSFNLICILSKLSDLPHRSLSEKTHHCGHIATESLLCILKKNPATLYFQSDKNRSTDVNILLMEQYWLYQTTGLCIIFPVVYYTVL